MHHANSDVHRGKITFRKHPHAPRDNSGTSGLFECAQHNSALARSRRPPTDPTPCNPYQPMHTRSLILMQLWTVRVTYHVGTLHLCMTTHTLTFSQSGPHGSDLGRLLETATAHAPRVHRCHARHADHQNPDNPCPPRHHASHHMCGQLNSIHCTHSPFTSTKAESDVTWSLHGRS
jgi:hypothetical protein